AHVSMDGGSVVVQVPVLAEALAHASPPPSAPQADGAPAWGYWAVGGVGVASLAGAIGFGAAGLVAKRHLETNCRADLRICRNFDPTHDNAWQKLGLGFSIALGSVTLVTLPVAITGLLRARSKRPPHAGRVDLAPMLTPHGAGVIIQSTL